MQIDPQHKPPDVAVGEDDVAPAATRKGGILQIRHTQIVKDHATYLQKRKKKHLHEPAPKPYGNSHLKG